MNHQLIKGETRGDYAVSEMKIPPENYNFVQIQKGYMKQWRQLIKEKPLAAEIMFYFMEVMGRTTNAVICSYKTLEEVTGYSRPSVARAIRHLKDQRWVDSVKVGSATAYAVNEKIAWQAARNQRQYAMFSATVIANQAEQESNYRELTNKPLKHVPFIEANERPIIGNERLDPPDQSEMELN